jgi:hypothetical protein
MNRHPLPATPAASAEQALGVLVEEVTARLQAGEAVDEEALVLAHPQHAQRLRELLPALRLLADLGSSADATGPVALPPAAAEDLAGTLGDFRLVREVGRGGMGVVYEAVQLSLNRRVALKVLPFAAALDGRQLQRFKNEAQAAAQLHHQHIVPVYGVGCERAVHYYAMQFIDGQTLADLIAQLRRGGAAEPPAPPAAAEATGPYTGPAGGMATPAASSRRARKRSRSCPSVRLSSAESCKKVLTQRTSNSCWRVRMFFPRERSRDARYARLYR